jgi:hypothetical protein
MFAKCFLEDDPVNFFLGLASATFLIARKDPYTYSLPGMVEKWQADFIAEFTRSLEQDEGRAGPPPPL